MNQRWLFRVDSYRPPEERIDPRAYEVAEIPDDRTARAFVEAHHYSASYPAARRRFGLYRAGGLVGVAVFSHPCNDRVLSMFPGRPTASIELGRLVLLDEVPGNGESWFVARCFEQLRAAGFLGVVSFSDPVPRTSLDGVTRFMGHIGTVYQATNGVYLGRGTARTLRLLPDGRVLNERSIQKVKTLARGYTSAVEQLQAHGAAAFDAGDPAGWLQRWLPRLTRPLRHPGNHKYAWLLNRRMRREVRLVSMPYPKVAA